MISYRYSGPGKAKIHIKREWNQVRALGHLAAESLGKRCRRLRRVRTSGIRCSASLCRRWAGARCGLTSRACADCEFESRVYPGSSRGSRRACAPIATALDRGEKARCKPFTARARADGDGMNLISASSGMPPLRPAEPFLLLAGPPASFPPLAARGSAYHPAARAAFWSSVKSSVGGALFRLVGSGVPPPFVSGGPGCIVSCFAPGACRGRGASVGSA
jgi:hypothetical protein